MSPKTPSIRQHLLATPQCMKYRSRLPLSHAFTGRSSGLTILELILALSISVIVIGFITFGIETHVRSLDNRRSHAEEAQLAYAILGRIADDLRNVAVRHEVDLSSVEQLMAGMNPLSMLGGEELGGLEEELSIEEMLAESGANTFNLAESDSVPIDPGLYGNQYELQVDVSRLPRIDEYQLALPDGSTTLQDIPSDVKTVTYYIRTDPLTGSASNAISSNNSLANIMAIESGLMRRSLSRAVTEWATMSIGGAALQQSQQVWAPEVASLEFHYFDGFEWLLEWDSSAQGLPIAVEIYLTFKPKQRQTTGVLGLMNTTTTQVPRLYRIVVRLPQAELEDPEQSTGMEALGL